MLQRNTSGFDHAFTVRQGPNPEGEYVPVQSDVPAGRAIDYPHLIEGFTEIGALEDGEVLALLVTDEQAASPG